jgi:8-oxo-dGTP diphosphatase
MTSSDAEDREYPKHPLVGVGAIVMRGDSVLLVKRDKEPGKGMWSIPGGLVEIGESVKDALRREVMEECGIEVEPAELLDVVDAVSRDEKGMVRFHYVIVDFLSEWRRGDIVAGSDVADARWTPLSDLKMLNMTESARTVIDKAVRRRES